jgi:hypothetical protein
MNHNNIIVEDIIRSLSKLTDKELVDYIGGSTSQIRTVKLAKSELNIRQRNLKIKKIKSKL